MANCCRLASRTATQPGQSTMSFMADGSDPNRPLRSDFSYTAAALQEIAAMSNPPGPEPSHSQIKARVPAVRLLLGKLRQEKVPQDWLLAYVVSQLTEKRDGSRRALIFHLAAGRDSTATADHVGG